MKKNFLKMATVCLITVAFHVCKVNNQEKDDLTTTSSLIYILDQNSGNCAFVQRLFEGYYRVSFTTDSKEKCNLNKFWGSDLASYKTIQETSYNKIAELSNTFHCSAATNTLIINFKNDALTLTQTQYENLPKRYRFFPVPDLRKEAIAHLSSSQHPLTLLGFSSQEILTLNRLTAEQYREVENRESLALFAEETLDTACTNALADSNRKLFPGFYGLDPDANTKAKITGISNSGVVCTYGRQSVATDRCATINTEF
ncbi:hypothetical protein [Leptospira santarosai]|uniref:hypothetical protein n=1 Tax=Leptospira santarosai TaxID=28183 RepID=UPI00062D86B6|nr:hypothetical protein [Leptospira santarosai]AVV77847.1 Uncharacterized protein XB15_00041 [Leptospira santarosai]ONF89190.1 hypothetical protein BWD13_02045 [Leptospira santarosai serovar Grippotyphosa]